MFTRPEYHLGDTWYFVQADTVHMYYLTCPLGVPRHTRWSIGHAVSNNLVDWEDCGVILLPGEPDSWDGICPATGSVVEFEGRYYMAYTGNYAGPEPTVGIAVSDDLDAWKKLPGNPVTAIDGQHYSAAPNLAWGKPRWRDPFLFREGDKVYQLVTAARPDVAEETAGSVGLAVSTDMENWEILPPLDVPALAQDLECPKLFRIDDQYHLVISVTDAIAGVELRSRQPEGLPIGTAYNLVSDALPGPCKIHGTGRILEDATWGSPYACEPVFFSGQWFLLGTVWSDDDVDSVCNPVPLDVTGHGFKAQQRTVQDSTDQH
jgi:beta-fructofuranosidase